MYVPELGVLVRKGGFELGKGRTMGRVPLDEHTRDDAAKGVAKDGWDEVGAGGRIGSPLSDLEVKGD